MSRSYKCYLLKRIKDLNVFHGWSSWIIKCLISISHKFCYEKKKTKSTDTPIGNRWRWSKDHNVQWVRVSYLRHEIVEDSCARSWKADDKHWRLNHNNDNTHARVINLWSLLSRNRLPFLSNVGESDTGHQKWHQNVLVVDYANVGFCQCHVCRWEIVIKMPPIHSQLNNIYTYRNCCESAKIWHPKCIPRCLRW